jgi:cytochrome P450
MRLHPVVPINTRSAVQDTVLPRGGGLNGTSPVFVEKGAVVLFSTHALQRREDLWGDDAHEFRPERWAGRKRGWDFLAFSGGPRVCLGQQFAMTVASYVAIRLLQTYPGIESRDPGPWVEGFCLTCSSGNGTQVALLPR